MTDNINNNLEESFSYQDKNNLQSFFSAFTPNELAGSSAIGIYSPKTVPLGYPYRLEIRKNHYIISKDLPPEGEYFNLFFKSLEECEQFFSYLPYDSGDINCDTSYKDVQFTDEIKISDFSEKFLTRLTYNGYIKTIKCAVLNSSDYKGGISLSFFKKVMRNTDPKVINLESANWGVKDFPIYNLVNKTLEDLTIKIPDIKEKSGFGKIIGHLFDPVATHCLTFLEYLFKMPSLKKLTLIVEDQGDDHAKKSFKQKSILSEKINHLNTKRQIPIEVILR